MSKRKNRRLDRKQVRRALNGADQDAAPKDLPNSRAGRVGYGSALTLNHLKVDIKSDGDD